MLLKELSLFSFLDASVSQTESLYSIYFMEYYFHFPKTVLEFHLIPVKFITQRSYFFLNIHKRQIAKCGSDYKLRPLSLYCENVKDVNINAKIDYLRTIFNIQSGNNIVNKINSKKKNARLPLSILTKSHNESW